MPVVRFVTVGDVMVDVLVSGREHEATVLLRPGGTAVNAALAAASAGAQASVLGRIGDDPAGRMVEAELRARHLHADLSVDPARPTGTFLVLDGEIRADRGANAGLLPEHLPPSFEGDAVLVSGYLPEETVSTALARSQATWTALAPARLARLPSGGNALFLNEQEARSLTGAAPAEAVRLLGRRQRLACVTMGEEGAVAVLDGSLESVRAEASPVRGERPGAGDAFAASVLVALCAGSSLVAALVAGSRAGAIAAQRLPE